MLAKVLESARVRLGRPPSKAELLRWAGVYTTVARGLRALGGRQRRRRPAAAPPEARQEAQ